jgi:predicted NBD/HSP70 family sugar kinase
MTCRIGIDLGGTVIPGVVLRAEGNRSVYSMR